jgi:integrase
VSQKPRLPRPAVRKRLDTKTDRKTLEPRREPYWTKLSTGRYLGFRKTAPAGEPGGSWIARYRDEDGQQQYKALGELLPTFDYDQAVAAALAWFRERDQGVTGRTDDGKAASVATACKEYVEDRRRQKGDVAANNAAGTFERRVYGREKSSRKAEVKADPLAAIPLSKFRKRDLEAWRDRLIEAGLDRASINREITHVKAALNLAVRNRLVSTDQAREWRDVKPFAKAGKRRDIYLDKAQRTALRDACDGYLRDLVEAAMLTGCRAGELTSATRGSYDHRTKTLRVTGKTGTRDVLLPPKAAELFDRLAKGKLPAAYLLTRDGINPWRHSDWDELVRAAVTKAKLPTGTVLYTLRHSWITAALMGGMSTLEVSKIVGTSLRMIEATYGHLVADVARERLAKVDIV